jgi:hypothetical protein
VTRLSARSKSRLLQCMVPRRRLDPTPNHAGLGIFDYGIVWKLIDRGVRHAGMLTFGLSQGAPPSFPGRVEEDLNGVSGGSDSQPIPGQPRFGFAELFTHRRAGNVTEADQRTCTAIPAEMVVEDSERSFASS